MTQQRYIVIQEWMQELDLNASELLAFALIWGFCQDGESDFHGSVAYVADWCKVKERQANEILRRLTEKGYVTKQEMPGRPNRYAVTPAIIAPLQKLHTTPAKIAYPTPAKIAYDNKVVDKDRDNKDRECPPRAREDDGRKAYGVKVRMTPDEYAKIVSRYGATDAAAMVQMLDDYLVDHPRKHYANHYRAAIGWPAQRLMEQRTAEQRLKNAQEAAQRVSGQQPMYSGYGAAGLAASKRLEELLKNN